MAFRSRKAIIGVRKGTRVLPIAAWEFDSTVILCVLRGERIVMRRKEMDNCSDNLTKNPNKKRHPGETRENFRLHRVPPDLP